jgi:DNA-binding transcriptional regulator YiaG
LTKIVWIANHGTMSPEQCRAARGWLGWSQAKLAKGASVSLSTVRDFEKGRRVPIGNNLAAMRKALESAGISFIFSDEAPTGVSYSQKK